MNFRDLTNKQINALKRKCEKIRKAHIKSGHPEITMSDWNTAFSAGVKETLALFSDV